MWINDQFFSKSSIEAIIWCIIYAYADDHIIITKYKEDYQYITDELSKSFKMKGLGLSRTIV